MNSKDKFYVFVSFLSLSLIVVVLSSYYDLSLDSVSLFFSANRTTASFLYTALFTVLASFGFSVSAMTSFAVLLFPSYEIIVYAMIGIMGSSVIDFYISRKLGRDYVKNYLEKKVGVIKKFERIVEKDTFRTTLILSAVFFVPPVLPNFLGGIMNISLKRYALATFLGNLPNTVFTVYLIDGLFYSNSLEIYVSSVGLVLTSLIALYFYGGEIGEILRLSFPWMFR